MDAKLFDEVTGDREEATFQSKLRAARQLAEEDQEWDPWHKSILRSIWFFGYEGSLTEPPCSEFGKSAAFSFACAKILLALIYFNIFSLPKSQLSTHMYYRPDK